MSTIVSQVRTSALTRRPSRLVYSASITLIAGSLLLSACGGGSDDSNDDAGPEVAIATFTPAPPDFTPEAAQTQAAQGTAFAQTATAQPPAPTSDGTPSGSPSSGNERPQREGEVRPPDLVLTTEGGQEIGEIGAFLWFDEATQTIANIQLQTAAPFPDDSPTAPEGSTITLASPNAAYPIESSGVFLYTFQDNIARPTDPQGKVLSEEPGFVPITDPVWQTQTQGETISVTPDVPPGDYILYARVNWVGPANVEQQVGPLYTTYTFRVTVS